MFSTAQLKIYRYDKKYFIHYIQIHYIQCDIPQDMLIYENVFSYFYYKQKKIQQKNTIIPHLSPEVAQDPPIFPSILTICMDKQNFMKIEIIHPGNNQLPPSTGRPNCQILAVNMLGKIVGYWATSGEGCTVNHNQPDPLLYYKNIIL